jgi:hypothetical protein
MEAYLATMSACQGTFIVNDRTEKTVSFDLLVCLEDTVISSLKLGGVDVKSDYIMTPATALKAGTLIRAFDGQKFSGVQLDSGSVTLVL